MSRRRAPKPRRRGKYDDDHRWKLSLLKDYVRKHGWETFRRDTVVPPGVRLYSWAHNRRQDYREGTIADWLVRELDAVPGWMWAPKRDRKRAIIDSVRSFTRKRGWFALTSDVVVDGVALLEWVANRRSEYRRGELDRASIRALTAIPGWSWEPRQARQQRNLIALREHVSRHGWEDFRVETRTRSGVRVGRWANYVRLLHRRDHLPRWLVAELEAIPGWTWEPRETRGERRLVLLRDFIRAKGIAAIRRDTTIDGMKIGAWYFRCRERASAGDLPRETARQLARIYPQWRAPRRSVRK